MLQVNLNGATAPVLLQEHMHASKALDDAMKALSLVRPHGRNYQTLPAEAYMEDLRRYNEVFAAIDMYRNDLAGTMQYLVDQISEKEKRERTRASL